MDKNSSEIVKLTERISKDPKSKLFVPLAEEYKKIGDVEMAVYVLTEGLKNNPGYVTARAILGRLLFEQGDFAGAQKELTEVVKVIPDNLLAQRKLGDICVLQNNPAEALKYYKIVLALNSRDQEVASLVADLEAGRDASSKLQQPKGQPATSAPVAPNVKPQTTPPKQEAKPQPAPAQQPQPVPQAEQPAAREKPAASPAPEPAPLPEQPSAPMSQQPAERMPESTLPVEQPSTIEQPKAAPMPTLPAEEKSEEPEEIFMVEPLEKEKLEAEAGLEFSAPQEQPRASMPRPEETAEPSAPPGERKTEVLIEPSPGTTEADIFQNPEVIPAQPIEAAGGPTEADSVPSEPLEKSDDFTTDTLAELYIAQGFYEKAIDIYERMLTDNPNSRGLKDKLDRVRAMASASDKEAEQPAKDLFAEPQVYSAKEEPAAIKEKPEDFEAPGEELSGAQPGNWPKANADEAGVPVAPSPELKAAQPKPLYTDFEPREYTPPKEEPEVLESQGMPGAPKGERSAKAATKSATAIRKDTIDRLEAWLKNIKKES